MYHRERPIPPPREPPHSMDASSLASPHLGLLLQAIGYESLQVLCVSCRAREGHNVSTSSVHMKSPNNQ